MLIIFAIQHRGIAGTASVQKWLAIIVLVPLLHHRRLPDLHRRDRLAPTSPGLVPPTAAYSGVDGTWTHRRLDAVPRRPLYRRLVDLRLRDGGLLYARTQGSEDATPSRRSSISGLLCCLFFFLVPFTFQGVLGHAGMLAPGIVDGTGVGEALANMVMAAASRHRRSSSS